MDKEGESGSFSVGSPYKDNDSDSCQMALIDPIVEPHQEEDEGDDSYSNQVEFTDHVVY